MLFADVEANGLLDTLDRLWTIQLAEDDEEPVVYADQPGFPSLSLGLQRLSEADKVVFHNGLGFDYWAIEKLYPGVLEPSKIIDTLVLARLRSPESKSLSLAALGEELGIKKGEHDDWSTFTPEMVSYARQDIVVLRALWHRRPEPFVRSLREIYEAYPMAVDCEHQVALVLAKQEAHGWRFDEAAAERLLDELKTEQEKVVSALRESFKPIVHERWSEKTGKRLKDRIEVFNPGSRQQIAERLIAKYKWKPRSRTEKGQIQVDEAILKGLEYPEAQQCAHYMRLGKMAGQLAEGKKAWLKLVKHGRIHGRVNSIGCRTHRMSHFGPNVAQVDSDPRMRALWLPDEGDVQVGCDAEGLELRMLAHYLARFDGGRYADIVVNGDVHWEMTQAWGFIPENTVYNEDDGLHKLFRKGSKTETYGFLYGAQDPKLGQIAKDLYQQASDKFGLKYDLPNNKTLGEQLRARVRHKIEGLDQLVRGVTKAHDERKWVASLDGRQIASVSPHSALNTLLQSAGAVVMKWALVLFEQWVQAQRLEEIVKYCGNIHDEVQLSVRPDMAEVVGARFAECITEAGVALGVRCPLSGSFQIGQNWSETH